MVTSKMTAQLYQRQNGKLSRVSHSAVRVNAVLDARMNLTPRQRIAGNLYGAYTMEARMGRAPELFQERVDGGMNGGEPAGRHYDLVKRLQCADKALNDISPLTAKLSSSKKIRGDFTPIRAWNLVNFVCTINMSLTDAASEFGWWQQKDAKNKNNLQLTIREVPTRKRSELHKYFCRCLQSIVDAWDDENFDFDQIGDGLEVG